jgi:predicted HD superfamily hydrolase involved in NAD metabolism
MSGDTFNHSLRVADLARRLASIHGVDPARAELAGIVHDIAEGKSDLDLLSLAEEYEIPISLTEARIPQLLHAAVGAELLRRDWGIDDPEILDAVAQHVTGGVHMSPLGKVLFLADKLEPERDRFYGGLDAVRDLATTSLDQAVLQLYAWRMGQLVESGRPVDERLVSARNQLIEQTLASRP